MNRRDLIRSALAGAGALKANAQHSAAHASPASAASGTAQTPKPAWKPLLFDDHQNATVVALSDLIIPATDTPGAKAAKVNEYIDLILHDGPAEPRNHFIEGLGWLDGHTLRAHSKPFVQLTADQQTAVLRRLDSAGGDGSLKTGAMFFRQMKRLTIEGYYTSKIGIDELNKGGRVPSSFGCKGGDHKEG